MTLSARIRAAAADKLTYREIAATTGAKMATVRRVVTRFKARLATEEAWRPGTLTPALLALANRRGRPRKPAALAAILAAVAATPLAASSPLRLAIPPPQRLYGVSLKVHRLLDQEAERRGIDVEEVMRDILTIVATDNLFNAILGETGD
jgi:hypothetical protein